MKLKKIATKAWNLLSSYLLSCILFFFLFILVVLGTIDQVNLGIYDAQKKYFDPLFLIYDIPLGSFKLPILLPGVYFVLIILYINTIAGTIKHIPFKPQKYGVYIIHFSVILLLTGSFITFKNSVDGQMTLAEGQSSNQFISYHLWQVSVVDTSLPNKDMVYSFDVNFEINLTHQKFTADDLPFTLEIEDIARNAVVLPQERFPKTQEQIINGFFMTRIPISVQNEQNIPAAILKIQAKDQPKTDTILITGLTEKEKALQYLYDQKKYAIYLHKKAWEVPFTITLNRVEQDLYPGTMEAKAYRSFIHKTDEISTEKREVYMNHPYRYQGYIFFQSGYYENPQTKTKLSTFAVLKNPTDNVPLYSCILISIGLLVHFLAKLSRFLIRESKK